VAPGLRGNDLLLETRQQQLPFCQRQTEIGDIAEIIGPVDRHHINGLFLAWFRICLFRVTQACATSRPVRAGFRLEGCPVLEAASLPGSSLLGLKRSQAQQGQPVRMALAGHQLPRALALALDMAAAHEAAVVQEEPQQVQV